MGGIIPNIPLIDDNTTIDNNHTHRRAIKRTQGHSIYGVAMKAQDGGYTLNAIRANNDNIATSALHQAPYRLEATTLKGIRIEDGNPQCLTLTLQKAERHIALIREYPKIGKRRHLREFCLGIGVHIVVILLIPSTRVVRAQGYNIARTLIPKLQVDDNTTRLRIVDPTNLLSKVETHSVG